MEQYGTAVSIRTFWERIRHAHCLWIQTVVYRNSGHIDLNKVVNFEDKKYDIDFIDNLNIVDIRITGYSYDAVRNDLAKTNRCLALFDELSEEDKAKDDD